MKRGEGGLARWQCRAAGAEQGRQEMCSQPRAAKPASSLQAKERPSECPSGAAGAAGGWWERVWPVAVALGRADTSTRVSEWRRSLRQGCG